MEDNFYQDYEEDLFGDPIEDVQDPQSVEEPDNELSDDSSSYSFENEEEEQVQDIKDDYLTRLLREKHIDRNKVRFENENGEIEEVSFDDLEDEDKYAILSEREDLPITDQEIEDINFLRDNDINLADFAKMQREEAIKEYLSQNQTPHYAVDDMDNDQLFIYDFISKYGEDFTDEELDAELSKAKDNEELFSKKMNALRTQYKDAEIANEQAEQERSQREFEAEKQELVNALTSAAINTTELQGIELEDADRNEVLDFLLLEDSQGRTEFSKLLSDPEAIFKMAWFMKYGESTFNTTVDYFKNELAKARRDPNKPTRTVVRKKEDTSSDTYGLNKVFRRK